MIPTSRIATRKQQDAVRYIEHLCGVRFKGNTKKEVYDFIGEWLPKAKKLDSLRQQIGATGVQMAEVHFVPRGEEVYAPDDWSLKGGLADELFKGAIMRGQDPIDALCDLQENTFLEMMIDELSEDEDYPFPTMFGGFPH